MIRAKGLKNRAAGTRFLLFEYPPSWPRLRYTFGAVVGPSAMSPIGNNVGNGWGPMGLSTEGRQGAGAAGSMNQYGEGVPLPPISVHPVSGMSQGVAPFVDEMLMTGPLRAPRPVQPKKKAPQNGAVLSVPRGFEPPSACLFLKQRDRRTRAAEVNGPGGNRLSCRR